MDCSLGTSDVSLEVLGSDAVLYPSEVNLEYGLDKYDYADIKFDRDTAQKMHEHRNGDAKAWFGNGDTEGKPHKPCSLTINDQRFPLYYDPSNLKLGLADSESRYSSAGSIKLYDLHKLLDYGTVDYAPKVTTVRETYRNIFNSIPFLEGIPSYKINIDPSDEQTLQRDDIEGGVKFGLDPLGGENGIDLDYGWALNFDEISPLKAIKRANEIFGLSSYFTENAVFTVGEYQTESSVKASVSQPKNGYHIQGASLSTNHEPLRQINLKGPKRYPDLTGKANNNLDDFADAVGDWLMGGGNVERKPFGNNENNLGYRTYVQVVDENVVDGKAMTVKAHNLEIEELLNTGVRMLKNAKISKNTGSITVNYATSGTKNVPTTGDIINIPENYSGKRCSNLSVNSYPKGKYIIKNAKMNYHKNLKGTFDVFSKPQKQNLTKKVSYIRLDSDPENREILTHKELYGTEYDFSASPKDKPEYSDGNDFIHIP